MESNKTLSIGIGALVVGLLVGYFAAYVPARIKMQKTEQSIERVKQIFPETAELKTLTGAVKSIVDGKITLDTGTGFNPLEVLPATRVVSVSDDTVIVRRVFKDVALFQKEMSEYQKKPSGTPPFPYREVAAELSDVKEGTSLTVEAAEDIKTKESFETVKIIVQP